ncbi:MAG: ATP-binding protein [Saprospiraceae bacterium]
MTIKVKYFLFVGLIHALITYLVFLLLQDQKVYFILSEILIIISIALSVQIYLAFIRPLQFMANGINALEDEDFSVQYLQTGSLELNQLVEVYNQMIENIRNERVAIQEQHFFLQRLIQAYPAAIIILDYDDKISELNPRAVALLEKKTQELIGRKLQDLEHPIAAAIIATELGESQVINGKGIERYKCEIAEFIHRGFKRKFIQVSELSKEMLAAEKRAYGKVIRMMAHEVNNSIGATNSILNIGVDYLEGLETEGQEEIQQALQLAIDRNHSLSQFMRNFAEVVRLPQPNKELVSIVKLLRDVARYMAPVAQEQQVEFKTAFLEAEGQQAILDPQQMEQALVNIVKNAIEATGQGGIIRFEIQIDPLTIIIANNGPGIDPSVKDQLFTPFFSTKVDGQGIGLTLVREIVMNHNATINLETRVDGWTYCTITFLNNL